MANAENDRTCQKYLEVHSLKEITTLKYHLLSGRKIKYFFLIYLHGLTPKWMESVNSSCGDQAHTAILPSWTFPMPAQMFRLQASSCIKWSQCKHQIENYFKTKTFHYSWTYKVQKNGQTIFKRWFF